MFVNSLRLPRNDAEQFADSTMGIPARRDVSHLACLHKSHEPSTIVACVSDAGLLSWLVSQRNNATVRNLSNRSVLQ